MAVGAFAGELGQQIGGAGVAGDGFSQGGSPVGGGGAGGRGRGGCGVNGWATVSGVLARKYFSDSWAAYWLAVRSAAANAGAGSAVLSMSSFCASWAALSAGIINASIAANPADSVARMVWAALGVNVWLTDLPRAGVPWCHGVTMAADRLWRAAVMLARLLVAAAAARLPAVARSAGTAKPASAVCCRLVIPESVAQLAGVRLHVIQGIRF